MKKLLYLSFAVMMMSSCMKNESTGNKQGDANMKRMQEFYDQVMNSHNVALIDSFCTPDFVEHQPFPGYPADLNGLKKGMTDMIAAYPDLNFKVNYMRAWGDTVFAHFNMSGTNSGSFMGMPATNKQFNIEGVDIVVIKDGKAVEHWGYMEEGKMMEQLGMGPSADTTAKP
jgi:steroid delta-isomerase-like uncharacterized protein